MYDWLCSIWKEESEKAELVQLPSDFCSSLITYVRTLKEESRMVDRRTVKANLLKKESKNVKDMITELFQLRCRKLVVAATKGEEPLSNMTDEEKRFAPFPLPFAEGYRSLIQVILSGDTSAGQSSRGSKMTVLRFSGGVPCIIGADLKTYGPFDAEDVASLPKDNAKVLTKQGLAERLEAS